MTITRRNRRLLPSMIGLLLFASTVTTTVVADIEQAAAAPIDLQDEGEWGPVENWPLVGIHAALDKNGKVVTYGTNGDGQQTGRFVYDVWNPNPLAAAGHNTLTNTTTTDLFCSLQINRADTGDMLLFGGDNWTGANTTNTGNPDINQLSGTNSQISQLPGMNRSRWYATGTTLSDGSIFVQGGLNGEDHPERWAPATGAQLLGIDTNNINWFYPRNFVIPDGRVFGIDTSANMYFVSPELDNIQIVGNLGPARRGNGTTAVMFAPGKILHFGGPTNTAIIIDVTSGNPVVTATDSLTSARHWVNGTLLPDGRVLATGGSIKDSAGNNNDPIGTYGVNYTAEVWDPATGLWTTLANAAVPRLYHSTALLLADGRVLTAGGGSPGPLTNTNAEIFSPDYLVAANGGAAPRPVILGLSKGKLAPGENVGISVSSGPDVARVTLVKTGSVTHSFDMEQRFVELPFTTAGNTVSASLPVNSAVVTPGFYLLSVLDENGIPSKSEMVHITAPSPDNAISAVDGQVVRLYQAYFQRNPDAGGFAYWRRQLLNGIGLVEISNAFAGGNEFVARYGNLSSAQFVDQIYLNVLRRPADAGGRAYWIEQLNGGVTRGEVMVAFSESGEFIAITNTPGPNAAPPPAPVVTTPVAAFTPEIYRLYLGYFLRAPDNDGLTYWTNTRQAGIPLLAVSEQFALSTEFQNRYGQTSNAQFVDLVYGNVLGRLPDAEGRAYWIQQLDAGMTRGELMAGFTESPEFINGRGQIG